MNESMSVDESTVLENTYRASKKNGLAIQGFKDPLQHNCTFQYIKVLLNIRAQGYLKVVYLGLVFCIEIYGWLQVVYFRALELKKR